MSIGTTPLRVELDFGSGTSTRAIGTNFARQGGIDKLTEALRQAKLDMGLWKVRIVRRFHASGDTPALQVQRVEPYGVLLKVKPGDNTSGVIVNLMVDRSKPYDAEEVGQRLRELIAAGRERNGNGLAGHSHIAALPPAVETDEDVALLILTAVRDVHTVNAAWPDTAAFVREVAREIGPDQSPDYWDAALRGLVSRGLLKAAKRSYALTDKGKDLLVGNEVSVEPVETVLENLDRIQAALQVVESLKALKTREEELRKMFDDELADLRRQATTVAATIDTYALSAVADAVHSLQRPKDEGG